MKLDSDIYRTSELFNLMQVQNLNIGVDGSASNDGSNMCEEVKRVYLIELLEVFNRKS